MKLPSPTSDLPAQTPSELLEHLHKLVSETEKMIGDKVGEPAAEAIEALRARCAAAQKRVGELYSDTREKVVAGAHQADEAVHAHPYQAIAIGAFVGLLCGALLGRRCHRGDS